MGLLDDAIREHLDLKRRRGADPNEVERLEREALGPVRRPQSDSFEASFTDEPDEGSGVREEAPTGDWPESSPGPSFADHHASLAPDEEFEYWEAPEPAPIQGDERGPVQGGIDVEPDAPAPRTPAAPPPAEEAPRSDSIDEQRFVEQETVEHDVEREELAPPEDDDMLEETPDFLQDTPDHDRLWFEQRPPRDFDLDG
jgi:hypothetical protein